MRRMRRLLDGAVCLAKLRESGVVVPILRVSIWLHLSVWIVWLMTAARNMWPIVAKSGAIQLRKD